MLSFKSVVAASIGELETAGVEPITFDVGTLATIPIPSGCTCSLDVVTLTNTRMLLVPLECASSNTLTISKDYAKCLLFQAKVDKLYLTNGLKLEEHSQTHS